MDGVGQNVVCAFDLFCSVVQHGYRHVEWMVVISGSRHQVVVLLLVPSEPASVCAFFNGGRWMLRMAALVLLKSMISIQFSKSPIFFSTDEYLTSA